MVATETIFALEDRYLKLPGLYALWTGVFVSNFAVLLTDDTQGASRDFNAVSNGLSVLYCGMASVNTIYGNRRPSTMLLTAGPIHQYAFWHLFAYYGGSDVVGSHPIGVMNWFMCMLVGMFTLDMIAKTWYITLQPAKYHRYLEGAATPSPDTAT